MFGIAVRKNGLAIQYAGRGPIGNDQIATIALMQNPLAFQYLPEELTNHGFFSWLEESTQNRQVP